MEEILKIFVITVVGGASGGYLAFLLADKMDK